MGLLHGINEGVRIPLWSLCCVVPEQQEETARQEAARQEAARQEETARQEAGRQERENRKHWKV